LSKVRKNGLRSVLVLAVVVAMILPASANLVPTTFGFPLIVQNGSTSAFNQDTASATDFEDINIDFLVSLISIIGPLGA